MKKILAASVLSLALAAPAHALTVDYETITGTRYSAPYGWSFSYDIGLFDDVLKVDVDVYLYGATVADTLLNRWESGIESIWSTNRFDVPILFNVDWIAPFYDQAVQVVNGWGRFYMTTWYTEHSYQEGVAAHEYGHMLGLWDEYVGGAVNPETGLTNTGGLMQYNNGPTLDYYYDPFLDWYETKLASYGGGGDPAPVPEPSTFLLVGAGLMAVMAARRRASGVEKEGPFIAGGAFSVTSVHQLEKDWRSINGWNHWGSKEPLGVKATQLTFWRNTRYLIM